MVIPIRLSRVGRRGSSTRKGGGRGAAGAQQRQRSAAARRRRLGGSVAHGPRVGGESSEFPASRTSGVSSRVPNRRNWNQYELHQYELNPPRIRLGRISGLAHSEQQTTHGSDLLVRISRIPHKWRLLARA